ncbi:MAG TPA: S41 family peptidase [Candidatus Acidoferrales bacterium]|nr:S41 family peptidase [Candidatus Acidoferrales bacterium]
MSSLWKKVVLALSVMVFAYVGVGYTLGKTGSDKTYLPLTVYSEVLDHIQNDYVEDPDIHKVTAGALHGLLDSLDPQSSYLSPLEFADYEKKLKNESSGQVGVFLSKRFGYIVVVSELPDSPAVKAGLRDGDLLESIAGFSTTQMSVGQAQVLLTGDPGQTVKVEVIRRTTPDPFDLTLTYAKLQPPHLLQESLQNDIAYLRVPAFENGTTDQIREKLAQFQQQGAKKLILDLRDCASGPDEEGISTAQLFLSSGTIGTLKGQTVSTDTFSADPSKQTWKAPMTVLISNGTAGPAEILAAAVADNHRGDTVGEATFGTASQQKLITLDDGAAIILTVANYFTPDGKSIPKEGVAPNVEVRPQALSDVAQLNQDQLAPPPPGQLPSADDPVMKKAIEILNAPAAAQKAA